jgi:hypothetical protein
LQQSNTGPAPEGGCGEGITIHHSSLFNAVTELTVFQHQMQAKADNKVMMGEYMKL